MKILIITSNVGKTAPGIVFEKLINGLSIIHEIDLLVSDFVPSANLSHLVHVIISKKRYIHPRISRFFITFLGVDLFDCIWAWKANRLVNKKTNISYDIVLSFLSSGNYAATIAGTYLSKKLGCKLAIHTTDAIPAPIGWIEDDLFYKGLKRMMAKYLNKADAFFSTNAEMLQYQLKTFTPKVNLITNVIYNSGLETNKEFPEPDMSTNYFVYTGGIYGARKVDYLIAGFEKLLELYPDSKLIFIGNHSPAISISDYEPHTQQKIYFIPYTKDLEPYYKCATALIDIDADIENDVFISSKMPIYLMINRIIISETGKNSPARHLFKGIESIIQCDHDSIQLCEAMRKSIVSKNKITFDDRYEIKKLFQLENIITQLNKTLNKIMTS